jgi:transmembrane sensor
MRPKTQPVSSEDIDTRAAMWAASVDRGDLSDEGKVALEAWLAQDRRHLGAYARARAVFAHFDRARALGPAFDYREFSSRRPPIRRTRLLRVAAAMLAGIALFVGVTVLRGTAATSTAQGEIRIVPLVDGSAVTLNTESRLAIEYSKAERHVELITGEALFNVAKDHTRPFIVRAGNTRVRAVGTSFSVRKISDDNAKVLVREGVVEVTEGEGTHVATFRVSAASELVTQSTASEPAVPVPPAQVDRELAWQQGMISLDGRTLREAAAEFARYSPKKIIIDDPDLARRTVTGLFSANNPVGFARAVANSMGLTVSIEADTILLAP